MEKDTWRREEGPFWRKGLPPSSKPPPSFPKDFWPVGGAAPRTRARESGIRHAQAFRQNRSCANMLLFHNVDSEKIDNFVVYSDKLVEVVNNLISANTSIKSTIASVLGYKTITSSLLGTYAAISEKTFEYKKIEAFVSNTSLLSAVYSRVSQLKANILMPTVFAKITDVISETFEKIQKIDIKDNVVI